MVRIENLALVFGIAITAAGVALPPARQSAVVKTIPVAEGTESPLRDRREFVRRLNCVKPGMTAAQVHDLLGKADDVWIGDECQNSLASWELRSATTAWAYGGGGHLTYATLGQVGFDSKRKVTAIAGQLSELSLQDIPTEFKDQATTWPVVIAAPASIESLPSELETRRILRLMARLRGYAHENDPLRVIQVVNALQPLGKDAALAVIDESIRTNYKLEYGGDGLFVVIRCLFEVPEKPGHFPRMNVGAPYPAEYSDPRRSPRFPVVLHRDIPFVGISGYMLAGMAESVASHLDVYRMEYSIRAAPLSPPDNPLAAVDEMLASPEWPDWGSQSDVGKALARQQALRLVDCVYRPGADAPFDRYLGCCGDDMEPLWKKDVLGFAGVKPHWDPVRSTYARGDRTTFVPFPEPVTYPRKWHAVTRVGELEIEIEREDYRTVSVSIEPKSRKSAKVRTRLFAGADELTSAIGLNAAFGSSASSTFEAPMNSELRVVLELDGRTLAEKQLRP